MDARIERMKLIDSLEVGDLIRLGKTLRIVRSVYRGDNKRKKKWPDGSVYGITLSILRCSWTRRPYTNRNRVDLYYGDLEIVQKGYGCERTPLEILLQHDINEKNMVNKSILQCCDVIGVVT